jgi:hypothetical protein
MNYVSRVNIASLLVVIVLCAGCKSKQEKPAAGPSTPQEQATGSAGPAAAPPAAGKPAVQAAAPREMADARAAAVRVLARMEAGDFAAVYKDSAPSFKQIGSEAAFVAKFEQTRQKTGVLTKPRELKFGTSPENIHVLLYRVENPRFSTEIRLSFERSKNGTMELVGLNQHDEPKK